MQEDEREYLQRRMARELEMAEGANCSYAAGIHAEMARLYGLRLEALSRPKPRPARTRIAA